MEKMNVLKPDVAIECDQSPLSKRFLFRGEDKLFMLFTIVLRLCWLR